MEHSIGTVARLAGVTVRTLHHYDEVGLVTATRQPNGHRVYDTHALEALQQVRYFRELGFSLDEISHIMSDPDFDRASALRRQRELLIGKLTRTREMVDAIELAIVAADEGETMNARDLFEGFDSSAYEEEARERWGHSPEYQESARRTARYTRDDWASIQSEMHEINQRFASLMDEGVPASSPAATEVAEAHRLHIDRWFYRCPGTLHAALGESYVADARFAEYYDNVAPGLATYVRDAIVANAN